MPGRPVVAAHKEKFLVASTTRKLFAIPFEKDVGLRDSSVLELFQFEKGQKQSVGQILPLH